MRVFRSCAVEGPVFLGCDSESGGNHLQTFPRPLPYDSIIPNRATWPRKQESSTSSSDSNIANTPDVLGSLDTA